MLGENEQTILSVRGLKKNYGAFCALRGIDLDIGKGEFVALLGPSGCGKSTTLMAVAGFVQPDAGSIHLAGCDITSFAPEKRDMGVVFQDYALFPHLNIVENVAFPLRMRGVPRKEREEKAISVLEQVQLPKKSLYAKPGELSGGQRQRVAVARALVFDPVMLLMDEPLAALDRRLRQHLQYELRHLQARLDTTVVYVTHDQEEALVLADRIVVMKDGAFEQVGRPQEVYENPKTPFVAGFLGESNSIPFSVIERCGEKIRASSDVVGAEFEAAANGFEESEGVLVVRPERLLLVAPDDRKRAKLAATVSDVAFLGDKLRAELQLEGGVSWTASVPAYAGDGLAHLLQVGAHVGVSWAAGDARLLAHDELQGG